MSPISPVLDAHLYGLVESEPVKPGIDVLYVWQMPAGFPDSHKDFADGIFRQLFPFQNAVCVIIAGWGMGYDKLSECSFIAIGDISYLIIFSQNLFLCIAKIYDFG